jgi:predicted aconitase with swiveling domain
MARPTHNQNSRRMSLHEPSTGNVIDTDENIGCHLLTTVVSREPLSFWGEIEMR